MKYIKIVVFLAIIVSSNFAIAQIDGNKLAKVEYSFEKNEINPNDSIRVIAVITPETGWHVYWKNPGDAGLATSLVVNLPKGFKYGNMQWEYPEVQSADSLISFEYSKTFHILFTIYTPSKIKESEQPISIKTSWLACKEKCIAGSQLDSFNLGRLRISNFWENKFGKIQSKIPQITLSPNFKAEKLADKILLKWNRAVRLPKTFKICPVDEGIYKYNSSYSMEYDAENFHTFIELDKLRTSEPKRFKVVIVPSSGSPSQMEAKAIDIDIDFSK